jgi:SAM-dependent methyltransferase
MPEAYADDLAYIHHIGFGAFATRAAPYVLELLAKTGLEGGRVVDLGCGSGIWARCLVDAGYEVHGVDISPAMVRMARRRVPEARFEVASFLEVDLAPCHAVTAMGEPLAYLFDGTNTRQALYRFFGRVFRALEPGGLLVFDLREPGSGGASRVYERAAEGDDWAIHFRVEEDRKRQLLTREITTFRKTGRHYRRSHETHLLRLYRATEIAAELRRRGFRTRLKRSFGELSLAEKQAGFVARKPA